MPSTKSIIIGLGAGAAGSAALYYLLKKRQNSEEEFDGPLEPGMILLECAKDVPGLLPVAFLVHAVAKNASENSDDDSLKFAQLIEALEILLLNAESLPQPLLGKFASALEKAEGLLRADAPRDFCALCAEFQECVDELSFEADVLKEVDIDPKSLFSGAGFPPPGPSEEEQAALTAAIEARRRSQAADEEETRLLQERNRLLAEQVAQMQKALEQQPPMPPQVQQTLPTSSQQRLSPQEFFNYFPVPPNEAERRVALKKSKLDQLRPPQAHQQLDAILRPLVESNFLGTSLRGLLVTLMADSKQTIIALLCKAPDGTWVSGDRIGISEWAPIPRKLTNCQYVVASGEMECMSRKNDHGDERIGLVEQTNLAKGDQSIAEALAPDGWIAMVKAHAAKVEAGGGQADPMLSLALATLSREHEYVGAPIRLDDGLVVGALCAMFGEAAAIEAAGRRAVLQEKAAVVAKIIESLAS